MVNIYCTRHDPAIRMDKVNVDLTITTTKKYYECPDCDNMIEVVD